MKPANNAMISLLDANQGTSGALFVANVFTFTLSDGTVIRMTDADCAIPLTRPAFPGDPGTGVATFSSGGPFPLILLEGMKWGMGTEADEIDITMLWASNVTVDNSGPSGFTQGKWDGALVQIERVYCPLATDPGATGWVNSQPTAATFAVLGSVPLFLGNISDITQIDRMSVKFQCKDRRELLNVPTPYNTYQPACRWPLYGAGCNLLRNNFLQVGSVISGIGTGTLQVNVTLLAPDAWFSQGTMLWTSGLNNGIISAIRQYVGSGLVITLTGGGGSGAQLGATVNSFGVLNSLIVLNGGSGYTIAPSVGFSAGGGTGATGSVTVSGGKVLTANIGSGGTGYANATMLFNLPLPNPPSGGDNFTAYPGCDHTLATCTNKFNNAVNFGGYPYVPTPETAV